MGIDGLETRGDLQRFIEDTLRGSQEASLVRQVQGGVQAWAALRPLYGGVAGATGAKLSGSAGWSSARNGVGDYTITFSPAFAAVPALMVNKGGTVGPIGAGTLGGSTPSASAWRVAVFNSAFALVDGDFFFLAVGP